MSDDKYQILNQTRTSHVLGKPINFYDLSPVVANRFENILTQEPETIAWLDTFW